MNNQNDRGSSIFLSALIGGLAGALVVYLSDDKRRQKIKQKIDDLIEEGEMRGEELRENLDDVVKKGKKNIAKKLKQAEARLEQ